MKKLLASGMFVFLMLNSVFMPQMGHANVEDAQDMAEEMVFVFEKHMQHCEEEGYNHGLIMDYQYHNGYVHGARDAYSNMLKWIDAD
jgi:hypothetical protein